MKLLKQSDRATVPAIQQTSAQQTSTQQQSTQQQSTQQPPAPIFIVIPETALQQYPFQYPVQSGNTPPPHFYNPQERSRTRDRRLDDLIRNEQEYMGDVFDDFLISTRRFCGALISWTLWRVVMPIAVIGVLVMALG